MDLHEGCLVEHIVIWTTPDWLSAGCGYYTGPPQLTGRFRSSDLISQLVVLRDSGAQFHPSYMLLTARGALALFDDF